MPIPPPKRGMDPKDYEKITEYDEWIKGTIDDVQYEAEHQFKGQFAKVGEAVRFVFTLDGHQFKHRTGWMTYSYGEKSNLFNKYLKHLVEGAQPDMDFDIEKLKGIAVKTMWSKNGDYDNLESIRTIGPKVSRNGLTTKQAAADRQAAAHRGHDEPAEEVSDPEIPF